MKYAYLFVMAVLLLAGCQEIQRVEVGGTGSYLEPSFDIEGEVNTKTFGSESELKTFLELHSGGSNYYGDMMFNDAVRSVEESMVADAPSAAQDGEGSAKTTDYSDTNVQVEGIDEADIIKTDGEYIYTISDKVLFIIKAYPGEEAEIISEIEFNSTPAGLFINDGKLTVLGNVDRQYYDTFTTIPSGGVSYFKAYDISNPQSPELLKEFEFEGRYIEGRMYGDKVYLVTRMYPEARPVPLPIIREDGVERSMPVDSVRYFNIPYDNPQMANIHAISLDSFELDSESLMVEGGQNLYMSYENIYITYTERINEYDIRMEIVREMLRPELTDEDKKLITRIKTTDNDILSQAEKEAKVMEVYQRKLQYMSGEEREEFEDEVEKLLKEELEKYDYFEYTVINKVSIDEGIEITANGKVPGHIINQFSLDEKDDVLRIATTISARWSSFEKDRTLSSNSVYTLNEDLEILDSIEGMAEDESIYATRFIDDRLYMVTFKQVDPFFVIDLADPENIKTLGELKIPGFSRYLHPYDDDTIIGIGKEATDTGRTTGLKISLFDVSDVSNPEEIAKFVTDERYADSNALYEHKAFLFDKEKELLVIPAYSYSYGSGEGYNGAFVFRITEDEIELRGLIDHSMGSGRHYGAQVERSLYIEDLLYTKSPNLLRINEIEDLSSVNNVTLKTGKTDIPVY